MNCESCKYRPATTRVRFHDHPPATFRVCTRCAGEAEGLTATILGPITEGVGA